ncbi:hypothetical protein ACJ41O_002730 [Fusarium nematophilum]
MGLVHHGLDLFNYDQKACSGQVLITAEDTPSNIEYDEYVVYKRPEEPGPATLRNRVGDDEDEHIAHHFTRDDASGTTLFDLAFRHGFLIDRDNLLQAQDHL